MDVFFSHGSVTDIPLYNCSAFPERELDHSRGLRRPLRGVISFVFGSTMTFIYVVCLRAMMKLGLVRNACYKIMFVIGHYDVGSVLINDVFMAYIFSTGTRFCDAPNTLYIMGCVHTLCWAGVSYHCLLLAFNRMMEILKMKLVIRVFFSPVPTAILILIGFIYSTIIMFFSSPVIFSDLHAALIVTPLGSGMLSSYKIRYELLVANNFAVLGVSCVLYGLFFFILRKSFKEIAARDNYNRLQHQVFIQCTLMCCLNFCFSLAYGSFLFLGESMTVMRVTFVTFQFTAGLQALIYLLCNQTILEGVKNDLLSCCKNLQGTTTDISSTNTRTTTKSGVKVISVLNIV